MRWKLLISDFDCTLVDNRELIYGAVCAVFSHFGCKPPEAEVYFEGISSNFLNWYHEYGIPTHLTRDELFVPWTKYLNENVQKVSLRVGGDKTASVLS